MSSKVFGCLSLLTFALPGLIAAQSNVPATPPAPLATSPAAALPPAGVVVLHDVVTGQGGGVDLHAEVAYPQHADKPMPAVIYVHGGGWIKGSYKQQPILRLAGNGFFAASIEYRLSNVAKWPAQIQDCELGVRWLRANAAAYHVDPNRIGAWGDSAGGHLVACLGTMADVTAYEGSGGYPGVSSAVQAVVDYFGPVDFIHPAIRFDPTGLFGVSFEQDPALWKSGSPLFYIKAGDPPVLIVHGDSDRIVPLANSTEFDTALTAAGVPHQLLIVKNADHGFRPMPGTLISPTYQEIQQDAIKFLQRYLKTP